jgi:hypothetical protein
MATGHPHPILSRYLLVLAFVSGVWTVEMGTLLALDRVGLADFEAWTLVGLNLVFVLAFLGSARSIGRSTASIDFALVLLGVHAILLAFFTLERFTYFLPYNVLVTVHHVPFLALDAFALIALGVQRAKLNVVRKRAPWINPGATPAYAPMRADGGWTKKRGVPRLESALTNRRR